MEKKENFIMARKKNVQLIRRGDYNFIFIVQKVIIDYVV